MVSPLPVGVSIVKSTEPAEPVTWQVMLRATGAALTPTATPLPSSLRSMATDDDRDDEVAPDRSLFVSRGNVGGVFGARVSVPVARRGVGS